jgi:hypothetical protein
VPQIAKKVGWNMSGRWKSIGVLEDYVKDIESVEKAG